jgi:hypothetical protein
MSQVKTTQKLQLEDVPKDSRDWVGTIIQVVNDYIAQSISILNGGIIFGDNAYGQDHTFDFKYQSDTISLPIGFTWNLAMTPRGLQVIAATANNDPLNVSVAWRYTEKGKVELTSVVQFTSAPAVALLTAGVRYKIRVRVTP